MIYHHITGKITAKIAGAENASSSRSTSAPFAKCEVGLTHLTEREMERQFLHLVTRSMFIRDKLLDERLAWCAGVLGKIEHHRYSENSTYIFSTARENYDVFLAHGDDPVRLAVALRRNKSILSSKVKVALMAQSLPVDRVLLLNAGFDLVADCRMPKAEFVARVLAIYTRSLRHAASVIGPLNGFRTVLRKYFAESVNIEKIRDRELLLLSRLAARMNYSVHSTELCRAPTGNVSELTEGSLSVAISKLRKKISPKYVIISDHMGGYVLKFRETGEPVVTV